MSKKVEMLIGKTKLTVSSLDKVLYPETGFTKGQVIDYYIRMAPVLLPHLRNRPITLKRYPEGVDGFFFYEKQCPSHRPGWVKTTEVPSRRAEGKIDYCMMNDLPALVWAANLTDLELHTFLHRAPAISRPTAMAFDLDPGAPADIVLCCRVALWLRAIFDELGLQSFPKTSGIEGASALYPAQCGRHLQEDQGLCARFGGEVRARASRACGGSDAKSAAERESVYRLESKRCAQDHGQCLLATGKGAAECFHSAPVVGGGIGGEERRR
jgi:DNA ligase D-like protein (predicted polymerase)